MQKGKYFDKKTILLFLLAQKLQFTKKALMPKIAFTAKTHLLV